MITNRTTLEFGNGDIQTRTTIHDGTGVLCLRNAKPHPIGKYFEMYEPFSIADADAVMIFKNTECIDAVIDMLQDIKKDMGG